MLPDNLQSKIISAIKSGQLKSKSRLMVWTEKLGLGGVLVLFILLIIFLASLVLVYLKSTDNLSFLSFGVPGWVAFLESFPYLLVIVFVGLLVLLAWLWRKEHLIYQVSFKYVALGLLVFIILSGTAFAISGAHERLEQQILMSDENNFLRPFFSLKSMRGRGVSGIIAEAGDEYVILHTPRGIEYVSLQDVDEINKELSPGLFAVVIGERKGDYFIARDIMIKNTSTLPIIKHGIEKNFLKHNIVPPSNLLPPGLIGPHNRECMTNCRFNGKVPPICFDECLVD